MKIFEVTSGSEFPKIRKDLRKTKNGIPHIGVEYYNGDMWYLPVAKDGTPVFTNDEIRWNDLLKRQLASKGVGFPLKYDGEYGKRAGQWMSQDDMWDYENEAQANSPLAKAEKENIAALKAAGVDWDKVLADAQAGKVPDKRIQDADDLMGYYLQQNGIEDATPDRYQISGFGWDENDDGHTFKDTSWFVKKGKADDDTDQADDGDKSGNTALDMLRTMQSRKDKEPDTVSDGPGTIAGSGTAPDIIGNRQPDDVPDEPDADLEPFGGKGPDVKADEPSITMPDGSKISGVRKSNTKRTTSTKSGTNDFDDLEKDMDDAFKDIDDVERVRRQGQANIDRVKKQGQDNIDRIRKLAGLN